MEAYNEYLNEVSTFVFCVDIYMENYTLLMGLLWQIIRKYQLGEEMYSEEEKLKQLEVKDKEQREKRSYQDIKESLLRWLRSRVEPYGEKADNFTTSLDDGASLSALVSSIDPSFDHAANLKGSSESRMRAAFKYAEDHLSIPALVAAEDMAEHVDEKSAITYVSMFYSLYKDHPVMKYTVDDLAFNADGEGWTKGKLGVPTAFSLSATHKKNGNTIALSAERVQVELKHRETGEIVLITVGEDEGRLMCSYTLQDSGTYDAQVKYDGRVVANSEVVDDASSNVKLIMDMAALEGLKACAPCKFRAAVVNKKNEEHLPADKLRCQVIGPDGEDVPVGNMPEDDGVDFDFTPLVDGLHTVKMFYGDEELMSKPTFVKPSGLHFNLHGTGLHEMQATRETGFTVTVLDGVGGRTIQADDQVEAVIRGADGDALPLRKVVNEDHSVSYFFVPSTEGDHNVQVTFDDNTVLDITVQAKPPPSAKDRHITLKGPGLHSARVGIPAKFEATMYDKPDGTLMMPDGFLAVVVTGPDGTSIPAYIKEEGEVSEVTYSPVALGEHNIAVLYMSKNVVEATVKANPAPKNLHFDIKGPGLHNAVVGEAASFHVIITDKDTSTTVPSLDRLDATMEGPEGPVIVRLAEGDNSKVTATYNPAQVGVHTLSLSYNGKSLMTREIVVSKPKNSMHFSLKGQGLRSAKVGQEAMFVVKSADKQTGKLLQVPVDKLKCTITSEHGDVQANKTGQEDGTVQITYCPEHAGPVEIILMFGEKKVLRVTVKVAEAPVDESILIVRVKNNNIDDANLFASHGLSDLSVKVPLGSVATAGDALNYVQRFVSDTLQSDAAKEWARAYFKFYALYERTDSGSTGSLLPRKTSMKEWREEKGSGAELFYLSNYPVLQFEVSYPNKVALGQDGKISCKVSLPVGVLILVFQIIVKEGVVCRSE